jgi:membrane-associated phospholipid phosphatase
VSCLWPRARTVALLYAVAIALSRIVVLGHFPSDVIAGAVVGTVGALLVRYYFALRRLGFSIGPDGTLHQLPGPSLKRLKAVARELLAP